MKWPAFARTIGIDYSGTETPTASLKGLRVYLAEDDELPVEVLPPPIRSIVAKVDKLMALCDRA
ncbi:hypothetical protein X739_05870 [Mesorhizobium sp. LNHC220B00]|nr:hypothetical protein [Mesorhizobium sp. LNHC220B00]ESY88039.1 hypothetical protein X739_05870 [Mesorhizobium sp. LNHC220B00]